jgi:hypothetical protein
MKKEFEQTTNIVERILKAHPGSRDSDKALILEFMLSHTDLKNLSETMQARIVKAVYTQMPAFETITRARRKLQADGQYKASMSTQSLRRTKAKAMKAMFR